MVEFLDHGSVDAHGALDLQGGVGYAVPFQQDAFDLTQDHGIPV